MTCNPAFVQARAYVEKFDKNAACLRAEAGSSRPMIRSLDEAQRQITRLMLAQMGGQPLPARVKRSTCHVA